MSKKRDGFLREVREGDPVEGAYGWMSKQKPTHLHDWEKDRSKLPKKPPPRPKVKD